MRRIDREEKDTPDLIPKLKYTVSKHTLVARTLLDHRLAHGLTLDEPVQNVIQTTLDGMVNVFSESFMT